jgi:hypothetical protein
MRRPHEEDRRQHPYREGSVHPFRHRSPGGSGLMAAIAGRRQGLPATWDGPAAHLPATRYSRRKRVVRSITGAMGIAAQWRSARQMFMVGPGGVRALSRRSLPEQPVLCALRDREDVTFRVGQPPLHGGQSAGDRMGLGSVGSPLIGTGQTQPRGCVFGVRRVSSAPGRARLQPRGGTRP